jgi:hypothetical protein
VKESEMIAAIERDDAWDTGQLGRDENAARRVIVTPEQQAAIDEAAGLQMISIRLPKALIEDFKFLGDLHGIKYQTLMRQILARFADTEMKNMARQAASAQLKAIRKESAGTSRPAEKIASK